MATTTPKIQLTKPASNENFSLSVINGNTDKIDTAFTNIVKKIGNGTISTSGWTTISARPWDSEGIYLKRFAITIAEIKETDYVQFTIPLGDSDKIAPIHETYNGGIYVYAETIPTSNISVIDIFKFGL